MTGLQRSADQFFVFLLTVFVSSVFGSSVGFFMSATIGSYGEFISSVQKLTLNLFIRISSFLKIPIENSIFIYRTNSILINNIQYMLG